MAGHRGRGRRVHSRAPGQEILRLKSASLLTIILGLGRVSWCLPTCRRSVAAWFSTRRRYLFPFAERLLWFSSALSSFPGQVPTQEVNCAAEGKVLACTPTSEITCCAGIYSEPRHFGQAGPPPLDMVSAPARSCR